MKEMQETQWAPRSDERIRNDRPDSYPYPLNEENLNMLKIMSHDLRGSFTSTLATLKLLTRGRYGRMDEGVGEKVQELFEKVSYSIRLAEECLDRALSVEESVDAKYGVVDLRRDIIHPVLVELSSDIKDHRLRIDNRLERIPARRIPIKGNRIWLKTIFRNLIKNAIQYGDSGGTIAFGFEIRGSSYRLNIYNSGNPIPEGWRDMLFTKVYPKGKDGNPMTKGLGIGLYLIKRIIQRLGGTIWYEAKEHGSNFVFTLPIGAH